MGLHIFFHHFFPAGQLLLLRGVGCSAGDAGKPAAPYLPPFISPVRDTYCCKNLLMVVNAGWRSRFAGCAGRCMLSPSLAVGWDVPQGPPPSAPHPDWVQEELRARTAQPAHPQHPSLRPEHQHLPAPSKPRVCREVRMKQQAGNY